MKDMFSVFDFELLAACIVFAMVGGFCDWILMRDDWKHLPAADPHPLPSSRWIPLAIGRLLLSACAGAIVWLLLVDALVANKGSTARLMLLAIAAGFSAPEIGLSLKRKIPALLLGQTHERVGKDGL